MLTTAIRVPIGRSWHFVPGASSDEDDSQISAWRGAVSLANKDNRTCTTLSVTGISAWMSDPGPAWVRQEYCIVSSASTASFYEVAIQQLQAIQSAGLSTSIETGIAAVSAELSAVYALDEQGKNRLAAQKIMILIESKLRKNALFDANRVLIDADVSKLSSRSMIGLIRSTFRVKKQLPAWEKVYSKSWRQVRNSGKSPEALFIGLPRAEGVEVDTAVK